MALTAGPRLGAVQAAAIGPSRLTSGVCNVRLRWKLTYERARATSVGKPKQTCFRLDFGSPSHLAALIGFIGNVFAKSDRCHRHWDETQFGKARNHFVIGEARVDFPIEPLNDLG
jgi:hypothetical protein